VRRRAGPLREREFQLLFTGRTISLVGSAIAPVALAFAVLDLTHPPGVCDRRAGRRRDRRPRVTDVRTLERRTA
jgi:hypothetical protein